MDKDGGFCLNDAAVIAKYRQMGKDVIKQVGRMVLSGKMELYKVGFPIKFMAPLTMLEIISTGGIYTPVYLSAAALSNDPVERMKFVMVNSLAFVYHTHHWEKPLNPILGETY